MDTDFERETLPLNNKKANKGGIYLSYLSVVFLSAVFFISLLSTGLLVHHYSASEVNDAEKGSSFSVCPDSSNDIRLPLSLKPRHYNIQIKPFINGNFSTRGHVDILFEVLEKTSAITLHLLDIITINESIKLVSSHDLSKEIKFTNHVYNPKNNFYTGILESDLEVGSSHVLSMDYLGYLNNNMFGFYRSSYTENNKTVNLATTQFEATHARRAFPCFDEPALKATFSINIGRQEGSHVLSNMPRINTIPIKGEPGWHWDIFNVTLPMSTYLIAFIVSDFVTNNSQAESNLQFNVWSRKEAISQTKYASDVGPKILRFYEEYFKIPFPLPKLDMVALPDFDSGAMENWGLITYRESTLLYDRENSNAFDKQRIGIVIAHELAHQWFGDLVSPQWWSELWLNEGFASYMEYIGLDAVEPDFRMLEQIAVYDIHRAFRMDVLNTSHPINVEVQDPEEIWQIFDSISYSKGASIIRMMNHFLTESTFRKGLTNYLKALSYSSATQDNLWQYLTEEAHKDEILDPSVTVKDIMESWTLQEGFPVVTMLRDEKGSAKVTQEKFTLLLREFEEGKWPNQTWWIPLTFVTEINPLFEDTKVTKWLSVGEKETYLKNLPSKGKWVILNVKQCGYYRVNYDETNWLALVSQLKNNHSVIDVVNRAQIIDDSFNLARSGLLDYKIALEIGKYLSEETSLVPWLAALSNFKYLANMFERLSAYGYLKKYLISVATPLYKSLDFKDSLDQPHNVQLLRSSLLSSLCRFGFEDCLNTATMLYDNWMKSSSKTNFISPNLRRTVYCHGIAEGGFKEWDFAWKKYLSSNLGTEKDNLLFGLGCTKQIWILKRYLELSFKKDGGQIRKQDIYKVFQSIADNTVGREVAWKYLKQNWELIATYMGKNMTCGDFTSLVANNFNTQDDLRRLIELKEEKYESLGSATQSFDQTVELVQHNIVWMKHQYRRVLHWLTSNGYADVIEL